MARKSTIKEPVISERTESNLTIATREYEDAKEAYTAARIAFLQAENMLDAATVSLSERHRDLQTALIHSRP